MDEGTACHLAAPRYLAKKARGARVAKWRVTQSLDRLALLRSAEQKVAFIDVARGDDMDRRAKTSALQILGELIDMEMVAS